MVASTANSGKVCNHASTASATPAERCTAVISAAQPMTIEANIKTGKVQRSVVILYDSCLKALDFATCYWHTPCSLSAVFMRTKGTTQNLARKSNLSRRNH